MRISPGKRITVRLVATLGLAYVLSQFLRSSNAVLAPELAADLDLLPDSLGVLTGAYFFAFALVQIPVGILLDRYGSRWVVAVMLGFAVAGCLVFADAENLRDLIIGRALMGLGCASILMGALLVYARWFPTERFATFTAIQLAIGNTGILLATSPLAAAVEGFGWRCSIGAVGLYALIIAGLILLLIKDAPPDHPVHSRPPESLAQSLKGVGAILRSRELWPLLPLLCTGYASVASISALWGGPYLADVHGLAIQERGTVLLAMAVGSIVGSMAFAPLDRAFRTRKKVVLWGAAINIVAFVMLALVDGPPLIMVGVLFVSLSAGVGYMAVLTAHARVIYPEHLVGRGMTVANMGNMMGVATLQSVTGAVIALSAGTGNQPGEGDYRLVFALLAVVLIIATLCYLKARDIPPGREQEMPARRIYSAAETATSSRSRFGK